MAKYFSHIDYYETGEGKLVNIAGGVFSGEDEFYKYLQRRVDPFYLRWVDIYLYDQLPEELLSLLKTQYPTDLDRVINNSGVFRFMHEFYLNASGHNVVIGGIGKGYLLSACSRHKKSFSVCMNSVYRNGRPLVCQCRVRVLVLLLDHENISVTLSTIVKAVNGMGEKLEIRIA
jgi:hypothetical protein